MSDILSAIDRATGGLCPCGAGPADGSAYCSDDCRPTHIGDDTDLDEYGPYATPARWRPDGDDDRSDPDVWPAPTAAEQIRFARQPTPSHGPRPVSASLTVRMSDGEEVTYDLHEGADDLAVTVGVEQDADDVDVDSFGAFPRYTPGGSRRYRVEVTARYGPTVAPHLAWTRRPPDGTGPGRQRQPRAGSQPPPA